MTKRIVIGSLTGLAIGLIGFFVAVSGRGMGIVMFLLVPVVAGFVVGWAIPGRKAFMVSAMISLVGSLVVLIAVGKEGLLCALMALPFLVLGVTIGALLGAGLREAVKPRGAQNLTSSMFALMAPLVIFAGQKIEKPILDQAHTELISTTVRVADTPQHTWLLIETVDSIHSTKPWLMYVGLPIPQRCTLERPGVGAKRTCYFDKGYIEETVTEWDPPHNMGLRIDRTHMPGRHWMGFENAGYHLEPDGDGTLLTRTTTISTHLYPRWYWRPLETMGVQSEHRYILEHVVSEAMYDATKP